MNLKEHLMASAERELGAFMTAVSELFGTEHARRAADDWLDELEQIDTLPETGRDFRAITIAAAVRLATWLNADGGQPEGCALDTAAEVGDPTGRVLAPLPTRDGRFVDTKAFLIDQFEEHQSSNDRHSDRDERIRISSPSALQ